MNYFILATESGELLLAENGYELAAEAFLGIILTDQSGQWLLTEDGRYILVTAGFAQPVLFIANVGRMMGR